jgi:prolyl-tRNA editing enzyme YbaK/EbsC (Cys-tRNA(Pro) deacylase)
MSDEIVAASIASVLRESGLEYEVMPCDPDLADTAVFCEHYGYPPEDSVNTIIVKAKTGGERFAACALLAHTRLDVNGCVRKRLASRRVSFASAEETERMTGMTIGGVTPLGLPADLPLWVDARLMERSEVILGGGNRHSKIRVPPTIFELVPGVEVVDGLAIELGK